MKTKIIIPKEIEESFLNEFFSSHNNEIQKLGEKYNLSYHQANRLIDQEFERRRLKKQNS